MKVRIYNSAGEQVYTLPQDLGAYHPLSGVEEHGTAFIPDAGGQASYLLLGAPATFNWDGRNSAGQLVAGGTYSVVFEQESFSGPALVYTAAATVIRIASQSGVDIYNSAGERVRHYNVDLGQAAFLHMDGAFVPEASGGGLKISWGNAAGEALVWDGLNDNGERVSSGSYQIKITQESAGASSTLFSGGVVVLEAPSEPLRGLLVAPNPVTPGLGRLSVRAPGLAAGDRVTLGLYNLAGELVMQNAGSGPAIEMPVPGTLSGGIYLLQVEARSAGGVLSRKVLKVAVLQ